jgi:hypothetical protein
VSDFSIAVMSAIGAFQESDRPFRKAIARFVAFTTILSPPTKWSKPIIAIGSAIAINAKISRSRNQERKMQTSSTKTLEFPIPSIVPAPWFDDARRVWNDSVFYLRWLQHYKRAIACAALDLPPVEINNRPHKWKDANGKDQIDWMLSCDITRDFRIDKTKSWDKDNIESRWVCSLVNPKWLTEPPIADYSAISLRKPFAQKRCEWLREAEIPQVYVNDFIGSVVAPAWEAYQKGVRGKPKYKREGDRIDTLPSESFRAQCSFGDGDNIKLPGLPMVEAFGLEYRLRKPIARLVEGMLANPENYPNLQSKLEKLKVLERGKLAKVDGIVLKDLKKTLSEDKYAEVVANIDRGIAQDKLMETAIAYFSKPGSFRLLRRDGKQYLQISCEMPIKTTATDKEVGIDTGLDLLIHSTSGLKVKHEDFSKQLARIDRLKAKRSAMKFDSSNYKKISAKIKELEGQIKRSRRSHQTYWASQVADVNGTVAIKLIKVKEAIEVPIPIPADDKYLPNGRGESKKKNAELRDVALGQFVSKVEQMCKKNGRTFTKVEVEPEASAGQVLEVATCDNMSMSVGAPSTLAQSLATDAREGGSATTSQIGGKETTANKYQNKKTTSQDPLFVSLANPPEDRKRQRRNRKREKAIG